MSTARFYQHPSCEIDYNDRDVNHIVKCQACKKEEPLRDWLSLVSWVDAKQREEDGSHWAYFTGELIACYHCGTARFELFRSKRDLPPLERGDNGGVL